MVIVSLIMLLSLVLGMPGVQPTHAANPAPEQTFYVTLPEGDALSFFDLVDTDGGASDPARPISTYFSIAVVANGTYLYYDQWENGYVADIANPTTAEIYDSATNPGGLQIWGNSLASDGCPPNKAGVALACTDANDVLNAGDVIIPYNDVDVSTNDVLDRFSAVDYNNNNGTNNWAGSWDETGDNDLPASGDILITSDQLRFAATADSNDQIVRSVSLPTGDTCATLSFTLDYGSGITSGGGNEEIAVEVDDDGTWASPTTLWTFDNDSSNDPAHAWGFDLPTGEVSANTRIRFRLIDALGTNDYWSFDDVKVMWGCGNNPNKIVFDARDKIGASSSIAMAKANWAAGTSTLLSFAHEIYPTSEWGTAYESPIGQDTSDPGTSMFQASAFSIMAAQNNTSVQVDKEGDGTYAAAVILNEGGSTYITGVEQGARVQSDKPIQVVLLTGDIDDTFESRDMTLLPVSAYGSSVWAASGRLETNPTRLWLYNPSVNNSSIYITCERYGVANVTSGSIGSRGVYTVDLNDGQGARCYASNNTGTLDTTKVIFGIGAVDVASGDGGGRDGSQSDWSYTLYPDTFLTNEAIVGLGLGRDPTSTVTVNENSSPLWVTAACSSGSTYVYVDWNNDGTADAVDTTGDGTAEAGTQNGIQVTRLQSVRLFEPPLDTEPYDQTGARVWSRTASGVGRGGTAGCNLALAWGQDLDNTSTAAPALDAGTSVAPLRLVTGTKSLVLKADNDGDGQLSVGDVATYNISITNDGPSTVLNVYVYDEVPANTDYETGTTQKDVGSGWTSIPDDGSGTPFPLDDTTAPLPDGVLLGNLAAGATYYVRFDVLLLEDSGYEEIQNCSVASSDAGTIERCLTSPVASNDWGDLPDSYRTSLAANGARHSDTGLKLGSLWDANLQGIPTVNADGDNLQYQDDEDGVVLAGTGSGWQAGNGQLSVSASGAGCLNAWMDFTDDTGTFAGVNYADGNFTKTSGYDTYSTFSEHIVQNFKLAAGTSNVPVTVPGGLFTPSSNTYSFRFRLSPTDGSGNCTTAIAPFGFVAGGEVEDYRFNLNLGSIGNYVWQDEDGDGDQDAGEVGIPNARVELRNASGTLIATTYTDANGGYVFTDLMPGSYTVTVVQATLPAGLAANPTYDENGTNTPHTSTLLLSPGEEYLTADFGYNWAPPTDTNNNTGTGAIGDRVWSDADSDGIQDPEEIGIQGVNVQLYTAGTDGIFGTADDAEVLVGPDGILGTPDDAAGGVLTNANGNYTFDNLPANAYLVKINSGTLPAGYTQTGDPDQSGLTCTTCDNQTTAPIVLAPGDVFVNADFGYHGTTNVGSIGDTVWLDADADGVGPVDTPGGTDTSEYGIAGVTVALIKDVDGDGVYTPGTDLIIATDITGVNGKYLFAGIPANGSEDYLVWVNDTENVLGDLVPTYDSNGTGTPNISSVSNLTSAGNLLQDFGYTPGGHTTGEGLIGDTIFLDRDGGNDYDPGEGLEGVIVQLFEADGITLRAVTTTDENGRYYFGDLLVSAGGTSYVVKVVTASLPVGVTNTVDPNGGNDNTSTVSLTTAAPVKLDQDFGYRDTSNPNSISGTLWEDTDSDGILDAAETTRFAGVTVVLKDANGDIIATTTTDSNGNYIFSGLPDGAYTVDVTDDDNLLNGYWHTLGDQAVGSDGTSKADPYTVTVDGNDNITTVDFGYYIEPALLGDYVWKDSIKNGIQDPAEVGIQGVTVILTIEYPDGTTVVLKTVTDANGEYSFGNLLLDESYDGVGAQGSGGTEPEFTVSIDSSTVPAGYQAVVVDQGDGSNDSRNPSGTVVLVVTRGADNEVTNMDFGYDPTPTSVSVLDFKAEYATSSSVKVTWTATNVSNINGFNLYRSETENGQGRVKINSSTIPVNDDPFDEYYEYIDNTVTGNKYYYWLAELVAPGNDEHVMTELGPAAAVLRDKFLFVPFAETK